jgi:hypothetical protein
MILGFRVLLQQALTSGFDRQILQPLANSRSLLPVALENALFILRALAPGIQIRWTCFI